MLAKFCDKVMGLLAFEGEPLSWNDIKPYVEHVKKHGIIQFINNYRRLMKRPADILKWGDEVSCVINIIKLCTIASMLLEIVNFLN